MFGDAGLDSGADTFVLPLLSKKPVPGVYLHACAALTELKGPLRQFTHVGRLLIDGLLSGVILMVVSIIRVRNYSSVGRKYLPPEGVESLLLFIFALLVVLLGLFIARATRIVWTDFSLVAIALALHRWAHSFLHHLLGIALVLCKEVGKVFRLS